MFHEESLKSIHKRVMKTLDVEGLPFSFKGLLGTAISGLSYMLHGHIEQIKKDMSIATARGDALENWAFIFGLKRKKAEKAKIFLEASGTPRSDVPKEWVLDGINFFGTFGDLAFNEKGFARFECKGDRIAGDSQEAVIRVSQHGVHSFAQVLEKINEVLEEKDDELRERIFLSLRKQKRLGTMQDYITWALELPGVDEAFVLPAYIKIRNDPLPRGMENLQQRMEQSGVVYITWLSKKQNSTEALRDALEKHIRSKAPATACIEVVIPKAKKCEIKIKLNSAYTEKNMQNIERKIKQHIKNVSKPSGFFDKDLEIMKNHISKSEISGIISRCQGGRDHELFVDETELKTEYLEFLVCQISFV